MKQISKKIENKNTKTGSKYLDTLSAREISSLLKEIKDPKNRKKMSVKDFILNSRKVYNERN
jgi:hypothetical protein